MGYEDYYLPCQHGTHINENGYEVHINSFDADFFGAKLRYLRKLKKLSQSEVAEALGVSQGTVSYWEKGEKLPDLNTFWILCQFLDVEPGYLMGAYKDTTALTGLSDDSLSVLAKWQNNPPPLWLYSEIGGYSEVNAYEKPPCLRAEVLNKLCFKYPDIFGKILDKLSAFMLTEKDIDIYNNKNKHIPKNERIFYFNKECMYHDSDDSDKLPHVTLDIDTFKRITQLEIMELLKDLREAVVKDNNKK